jgi:hypothetical protein
VLHVRIAGASSQPRHLDLLGTHRQIFQPATTPKKRNHGKACRLRIRCMKPVAVHVSCSALVRPLPLSRSCLSREHGAPCPWRKRARRTAASGVPPHVARLPTPAPPRTAPTWRAGPSASRRHDPARGTYGQQRPGCRWAPPAVKSVTQGWG